MISNLEENLAYSFLYLTLPGGAGGFSLFLLALKRGHYKNNHYIKKFFIEIFGAMLTASFITSFVTILILKESGAIEMVIAFIIGMAWAEILQILRSKITAIVETALGERFNKEDV